MVQSITPPPLPSGLEDSCLPLLQIPNRLREKLPPELFAFIESAAQEINKEVTIPLLCAENDDRLRELFLLHSPEYAKYALLISLLVWSALKESLVGGFPETYRSLQATIEDRGPRKMGRQATDASLSGLAAFTLVTRGIARTIKVPSTSVHPEGLGELFRWTLAFNVALLPVVTFLLDADVPAEPATHPATHNVQVLAQWSRYYGIGAYRMAKNAGIISVPAQLGEDPYTTEEMVDLSETAIGDMSQLLD